MKERPITFSAQMVRAILEGRKTQTRRVVKPDGKYRLDLVAPVDGGPSLCPYGRPGDRLWVRETHAIFSTHGQHREDGQRWGPWGGLPTTVSPDGTKIAYYREGFDRCDPGRWRSPIHMPRWASRIALEVTAVRVERLKDISDADARAEGLFAWTYQDCDGDPRIDGQLCEAAGFHWRKPETEQDGFCSPVAAYLDLWEFINGPGSWDANPWVWVIEFKRAAQAQAKGE